MGTPPQHRCAISRRSRGLATLLLCIAMLSLPAAPAIGDTPPATWKVTGSVPLDGYGALLDSATKTVCGDFPGSGCDAPEPFPSGIHPMDGVQANLSCISSTCIGMLYVEMSDMLNGASFGTSGLFFGRAVDYASGASATLTGSMLAMGSFMGGCIPFVSRFFSIIAFQPITITLNADGSHHVVIPQNRILSPVHGNGPGCGGEIYTLDATWTAGPVGPGFSIG